MIWFSNEAPMIASREGSTINALCRLGLITGFVLLLLTRSANAQVATGSLTGIATDTTNARLPGVAVVLTNIDTGIAYRATTSNSGEYTLALLPPGKYRLDGHKDGFRGYSQAGVVVETGRPFRIDFRLSVGDVNETVEVTASTPLIESENSTVGQFIENKSVTDMPLNGRRVGELLALTGNTVFIGGDVIRPRVAVAGGRGDQQQWVLDGVNNSSILIAGPQALFNPPVEATQEIRVQQNNYSAEYGNSTSGVVNITTRSGTNRFHGSAYEFVRNDKLDARNFFAANKAPLRWNVFGLSVGGPIRRNRTFFFSHNEWQRQRIGITRTLTVPTAAERSGNFSQTVNAAAARVVMYDPATTRPDPANPARTMRDPFAANIIPSQRLDPVGLRLTSFYPQPNRAPSNQAGANNFVGNNAEVLNIMTWTTKVDHMFSDRDRVTVRFIINDFPTATTPVFDQRAADPFGNETDRRASSTMLNYSRSITPTLINDARFNWQIRRFRQLSLESEGDWPTQIGLKGVTGSAFPRVAPAGFSAMGAVPAIRIQEPIRDTQFVDSISWFRSRHSFKFGGEYRKTFAGEKNDNWISGNLTFAPQPTSLPGTANTGNSIASMLVGFPNRGQVRTADRLDRLSSYVSLYAQDDLKLTSRLTLNVGIRWEAHTPRLDRYDRQNNFDRFAINPVSGTPGSITFAGRNGEPRSAYDGDYNNFSPRIGLAWQPFGAGKTVIRTGYGIFYGVPVPGGANLAAGFSSDGDFESPDNGITAPFLLNNGFPAVARQELGPGFGAVRAGQAIRFSPQFFDRNRAIGYSQQFNFGIQHSLGWVSVAEISYLGNLGHKLPGPDVSINQVPEALLGAGNAQVRRPFPQYGTVTSVAPMWGNSSYHALNVKLDKRFSSGLSFLGNYTWSKFIDDVPATFEAGASTANLQNLYSRAAEKALSGNDVRHRFVASSVYELPFGRGRRWLSQGIAARALGGWNLGGIVTFQAGSPFALTTQTNTLNAFNPGQQRASLLRDPALPGGERRVNRFFDTAAVVAPPSFTFGTASRSPLIGPGLANYDFSLLKNHTWGESYNIQVRLESFNALNRANFEEPAGALGSPAFGVISNARAARSIQLGIRFEF